MKYGLAFLLAATLIACTAPRQAAQTAKRAPSRDAEYGFFGSRDTTGDAHYADSMHTRYPEIARSAFVHE